MLSISIAIAVRRLHFILIVIALSKVSYAQVKKAPIKPSGLPSKVNVGPFKPEDFDYYMLVDRRSNIDETSKPYYSLATTPNNYLNSSTQNYSGGWVVMDVRTGKEVGWWPRMSNTYYSPINQQLYVSIQDVIVGHSATGVYQYQTRLMFLNDPKYKNTRYSLSSDWKKAIFTYNNDIMVADFDLKTGKLSTPNQVTFAGVFGFDKVFMKDDFIITARTPPFYNYIIDSKTGKFTRCGDWVERNQFISDLFVAGDNVLDKVGWWKASTQQFFPFDEGFTAGFTHLFWSNREQTANVILREANNSKAYYHFNPAKTNNLVPLNWPGANLDPAKLFAPLADDLGNQLWNKSLFSPSNQRFLRIVTGGRVGNSFNPHARDKERLTVLYDVDANSETVLNLNLFRDIYTYPWSDETHFFFNAESGVKIEGKPIDTSTQGTYVYDVNTKKATRVTPYFMTERNRDDGLWGSGMKLVRFPKANWVVFEANNFLFRCRPDGSEMTMLTKAPQIYELHKNFLDENFGIK